MSNTLKTGETPDTISDALARRPLRVLHTISSSDPKTGGAIEGVRQLGTSMAALGVETEVLTVDDPDHSPWLDAFPLKVHAMGPGRGKFGASARFEEFLRDRGHEYDFIIGNGLWQFTTLAIWRTRHDHRRRYFVFTHGMLDPWFRRTYPLKHLKKQAFWVLGQHQALRDAAAVLYTCEEERRLAQHAFRPWGGYREKVVAFGTAGPSTDAVTAIEAFHGRYPHLRSKRIVLFMSRIHEKKGCDLLIRAFARFAPNDPSLHLVMAGPDQVGLRAGLEALAAELGVADRIEWTGMLEGPLKWGAYAASEVFALTSHQENFGVVVAEALSMGVPTLLSNKVNIWREVLADGAAMVANDDQDGADDLLARWLTLSRTERLAMREAARRCFEGRFEIGSAASVILNACLESVEALDEEMRERIAP